MAFECVIFQHSPIGNNTIYFLLKSTKQDPVDFCCQICFFSRVSFVELAFPYEWRWSHAIACQYIICTNRSTSCTTQQNKTKTEDMEHPKTLKFQFLMFQKHWKFKAFFSYWVIILKFISMLYMFLMRYLKSFKSVGHNIELIHYFQYKINGI